jgi:hypothetical protein
MKQKTLTQPGSDYMIILIWVQHAITELTCIELYYYGFKLLTKDIKNMCFVSKKLKLFSMINIFFMNTFYLN